ncbi:MAG TPA: DUF5996 family protein [Gemmatimonadaceae bacterium]
MNGELWPRLVLDEWQPTYETLHRWTQIVGKTRLHLAPFQNHWWHCALYVTAHGLTTSPMPCDGGLVEIEFDFLNDVLTMRTSDNVMQSLPLEDKSVAEFYRDYRAMLDTVGVHPRFVARPNELPDATPFAKDITHATYDAEPVRRWWRALTQADRLLKRFRGGFVGKSSPSHFWWGSFDVSCTRFSGRRAPLHPGGVPNLPLYVVQEAYSRECISAGWWPGSIGSAVADAAFYAYAYPEPAGCDVAPIEPGDVAYYSSDLHEWILPYEAVREAPDPDAMVMRFFESTYEAAAIRAGWDIEGLRSDALEVAHIESRGPIRY